MSLSILRFELLGQSKVEQFRDFIKTRASIPIAVFTLITAGTVGMKSPIKSNIIWFDVPIYDPTIVM